MREVKMDARLSALTERVSLLERQLTQVRAENSRLRSAATAHAPETPSRPPDAT
jgi:hypothetical protein